MTDMEFRVAFYLVIVVSFVYGFFVLPKVLEKNSDK